MSNRKPIVFFSFLACMPNSAPWILLYETAFTSMRNIIKSDLITPLLYSMSFMQSLLLHIITLEVWWVKYSRWHGDFSGICFSSLSVSHEDSCAKVFNSSYLPGFEPENSKQSHQSSPTWLGSRTQWHASVTDGACRERDALIGCSTQACCKLSH